MAEERREDGAQQREAEAEGAERDLDRAERGVKSLEEDTADTGAGEGPATEVPSFSDSEREALSRMEFAVCVGRFYSELAERLEGGAIEGFSEGGVSLASVETHEVPGAFELPLAARLCADSGRYAGVVCLGAVIRGETDHYDHVCSEAARGIQQVAIDTGVPCAFGVITCDTMEQAIARSGGGKRDQGRGAALTAMRMALLARELR